MGLFDVFQVLSEHGTTVTIFILLIVIILWFAFRELKKAIRCHVEKYKKIDNVEESVKSINGQKIHRLSELLQNIQNIEQKLDRLIEETSTHCLYENCPHHAESMDNLKEVRREISAVEKEMKETMEETKRISHELLSLVRSFLSRSGETTTQ